jgi:hypothetical protein
MGPDQRLVEAFYEAALFLKDKIEHAGWQTFSANYLREHVRCRHGYKFTNSLSPVIMDEVINQHPELAEWIRLHKHRPAGFDYVMSIVKHLVPARGLHKKRLM